MPAERLKIGFVFDDSLDSSDGVAQYVKTLGRWLSAQGHEVRYLVGQTAMTNWSGGKVYSLAKNITVDFNRNRMSIPLPASSRRIKQVLDAEAFDILHVQLPYSPFLAQKIIKSTGGETAVIGTFHILPAGWLAKAGSKTLKSAYGRSLERFDEVISVSPPAAGFALKTFGLSSVVLPNVIDVGSFNSSGTKPVPGLIVFLGRLVPRKGALQLLRAFKILHAGHPDYKLVIAGDGPEKASLLKFTAKARLERAVQIIGRIPEADKSKLLGSASVACFPSTGGESFGIVLLEAMASGARVVLAGNNDGYRSVLGGQPDLLINPNDPALFAQRLKKLLSNEDLAGRLSRWQTAEVKKYDVELIGKELVKIYRQAIANRRRKSDN